MADNRKHLPPASGGKSLKDDIRPEADEVQVTEPNDGLKLVYLLFVLHGIGILLPWNSFINAFDYFINYKLKNTNEDYKNNFMNYIGLASQLPNLLLSAFNVFFQSTRSNVQTGSSIPKLMVVIAIEIGVCTFTCAMAIADSSTWPRLFFDLTIVSVVVLNCCTGVYQSSAFGMAALLPMTYSNAIVLGNNICGTLIAVVNILCKVASTQDPQKTAISYFVFSTLILACCIASLFLLPKLRFYRHYQSKHFEIPMNVVTFSKLSTMDETTDAPLQAAEVTLSLDTTCKSGADEPMVTTTTAPACADVTCQSTLCQEYADTAGECCACFCGSESLQIARRYWLRYWLALKDGWVHCLSIWSIFFCTLSCFPAVQSAVKPVYLQDRWFTDVYVFLCFNLFAMLGNVVSNFIRSPSHRWLSHAVWCRTLLFIPFFVLCNCQPASGRSASFPVLINSDAAFILGMMVFGFTSGYFSSLCMMYAPRYIKHPEYANLVAMLATFFLVLGVVCGISFGTVLTNVIQIGSSGSIMGYGSNRTDFRIDNATAIVN